MSKSAEAHSAKASALGRAVGDPDLEMHALSFQGLALVSQGPVRGGMRMLDEATTAALGEIRGPGCGGEHLWALIYACERVYDYPRAAEWCERLKEMSARWSYRLTLALCRTQYAGVLLWRGR